LTGFTLGNIRNGLFVQSWRAEDWAPDQADSILMLMFEKHGKGGRLTMVHANIPDEHYAGIKTGWTEYYWEPWKRYLAKTQRGKK
jgi:activator of HSP90 ATPase